MGHHLLDQAHQALITGLTCKGIGLLTGQYLHGHAEPGSHTICKGHIPAIVILQSAWEAKSITERLINQTKGSKAAQVIRGIVSVQAWLKDEAVTLFCALALLLGSHLRADTGIQEVLPAQALLGFSVQFPQFAVGHG